MTTTVAVLSPGDMGHSIGAWLRQHGARVLTCVVGRSARTQALAAEASLECVPALEDLVREADIVLSVLVPAQASTLATNVTAAIGREGTARGRDLLYVDCNAIAPATVREIATIIDTAGAQFADAGIIGSPPRQPGTTRFYTSGPGANQFATLREYDLDVRVLPGPVGQASGFKMCYAALTKGFQALGTELLLAAELYGFADELAAEQRESVPELRQQLERSLPAYPPKAHRWVGEMEEIAKSFADLGLTPRILAGAADLFQFVASTPPGQETPENRDRNRDLAGLMQLLAAAMPAATPPPEQQ